MSLRGVAQETLQIIETGRYQAPSGATVELRAALLTAIEGTVLYRPGELASLVAVRTTAERPRIEVTEETTQIAARRLFEEGEKDLVLLNYASARNAGGGFLGGAKAQEEDLCRCSALYACLITQPDYYQLNRAQDSMLYTDHLIYSPRVPFFRESNRTLLETPIFASVITSPAPNAGEHLRRASSKSDQIETTLRRRAGHILAVARERKHRTLLLGAWGCGVFKNDPRLVADAFGVGLENGGGFDRVVFAVPKGNGNLEAFYARFR